MSGSFRLNRNLFKQDNLKSPSILQASYDTRLSRPTLAKYILDDPKELQRIDVKVLYSILVEGMGLTPDDISNMSVGQLFDIVEDVE